MRKIAKEIHLWLSVPFGVLITLICFSGAMLVFEKEIVRIIHADFFQVTPMGDPLSVEQVADRVAQTLADDVQVAGVTVSADSTEAYQVSLSKPRRASVYVNQYTGEIKGLYQRPAFFSAMFSMHRWLMGSRPEGGGIFWGKLIVGVSTLLFVIVLLSGIVIWWPRTKKALKNSLKITMRKGWRRFWYGSHVAGGMYALLFLLVMALTGLTWSFDWYRTGFYKLFGVELQDQQNGGHQSQEHHGQRNDGNTLRVENRHGGREKQTAPFAHWQQALEEMQRLYPDYAQITVSDGSTAVSFSRLGNQRSSDRYTFNPRTGELTGKTLYEDAEASGKIRGWIYSVHVGSFGGWLTRILWFLTALLGATLPLTGYYLWIRRIIRQ